MISRSFAAVALGAIALTSIVTSSQAATVRDHRTGSSATAQAGMPAPSPSVNRPGTSTTSSNGGVTVRTNHVRPQRVCVKYVGCPFNL